MGSKRLECNSHDNEASELTRMLHSCPMSNQGLKPQNRCPYSKSESVYDWLSQLWPGKTEVEEGRQERNGVNTNVERGTG